MILTLLLFSSVTDDSPTDFLMLIDYLLISHDDLQEIPLSDVDFS